ncbi:hypothetical protein [Actinoplanes sp. NPDC049599]|uniref:hypothetical protein n=1 Tax=Actinoplanes sp. NPDC049599 TaxID=3363903 RepID=UPI0037A9770B
MLAAFGTAGDPVRLAGGEGGTWRVGDLMLKLGTWDAAGRPQEPYRPVMAEIAGFVAGQNRLNQLT